MASLAMLICLRGFQNVLLVKWQQVYIPKGLTIINSFTSSIIQEYSVTDAELDLFKVEEILDGNIYRTLENQSSGTKFTFTLSGINWTNLSAGQHELIIRVTDIATNQVQRRWIFNKIIDTSTGTSANLTRPSIITPNNSLILSPINALIDNEIDFKVVGGELFYYNEINIVNNSDSSVTVFNRKTESFDYYSIIPKNALINGQTYQIKLRTYNSNNQYSKWSDTVLVKCLTPPDLMITSVIDGKIENSNPIMTGTYHQAENDNLYSYEFNLYKDGELIQSSDVLLDGLLQFQFSNLDNKTNYTVELKVVTTSGMQNSITQDFYCMYLQTKLPAVMKLINNEETGSIQIKTYVRQILEEYIVEMI
jgi:SHS2 domain-containing protein